jgi:hypothetical protein
VYAADIVPHEEHDKNNIACVSNTATMLPAAKIPRVATTMLQQSKDTMTQSTKNKQQNLMTTYHISS